MYIKTYVKKTPWIIYLFNLITRSFISNFCSTPAPFAHFPYFCDPKKLLMDKQNPLHKAHKEDTELHRAFTSCNSVSTQCSLWSGIFSDNEQKICYQPNTIRLK